MRSVETIALTLLLFLKITTCEPILDWQPHLNKNDILPRADLSWTTQAFQTHCNNIDYTYYSECCAAKSGSGWLSCNDVGSWSLSGSTILCYNLDAGHDCCNDNSICDTGLGCCGNTCCQNSASVTVCEDGCMSKNGLGCVAGENGAKGTCAHGVSVGSSSTSKAAASTTTTSKAGSSSTPTPDPSTTASSPTNTVAPEKSSLSSGGIIGIAVSVGCSVIGLLFGIGFKIYKYNKLQKENKQKKEEEARLQGGPEGKLRVNSFPSAPVSPSPDYTPYSIPAERGFSPVPGGYTQSGYYGR
ncbi:hypothetical protein F5882DRAFT_463442 [Hyaloscypha sp. PMI_1271]|nr:hypothetical protein F5882DRAFT_463442 [Hyaloscypha sp. PMI_1271]